MVGLHTKLYVEIEIGHEYAVFLRKTREATILELHTMQCRSYTIFVGDDKTSGGSIPNVRQLGVSIHHGPEEEAGGWREGDGSVDC